MERYDTPILTEYKYAMERYEHPTLTPITYIPHPFTSLSQSKNMLQNKYSNVCSLTKQMKETTLNNYSN